MNTPATLHTLMYISTASGKFNEQDLEQILSISRKNNAQLDISGMLVYGGGNFIQILEGDKDAIFALYNKIKINPDHHGFITLLDHPIENRIFADWSMAYKSLTLPEHTEVKNYINTLNNKLDNLDGSNSIVRMLKAFIVNNT